MLEQRETADEAKGEKQEEGIGMESGDQNEGKGKVAQGSKLKLASLIN